MSNRILLSLPALGAATTVEQGSGIDMLIFETVLGLLLAATALSALARRAGVPYPTLLALGGAFIAFIPGAPRLDLPPDLILALFVAPVLMDAAYDASLRDLKKNWRPVS